MKLSKKDIAHHLGPQGMAMATAINNQLRMANTYNAAPNLIDVAPLIAVSRIVKEEKYSKYPFADLVPTTVGNELRAFGKLIFTENRASNGFFSGFINNGTKEGNLERVDSGLTAQQKAPNTWAKTIDYTVVEIAELNSVADYSLAEKKEKARKMEWDEGLVQVSIIGGGDMKGLIGVTGVSLDTTIFATKSLADMTAAELVAAAIAMGKTYQAQNKYKGMPNRLAIDLAVYSALAAPYNVAGYATETKLDVFQRTLQIALAVTDLKIVGAPMQADVQTYDFYVLFPYSDDTIVFDIGCDYTPTNFMSKDGFHFSNTAYGQIYDVHAERPSEIMKFQAVKPT